mmetsp:Transcript_117365/g.374018  ORF Transcript_117365/g.374018 Transcript_117365/m.374018 type:complete len:441 (-) Transcript_117365:88-1410(-)|eukprot:CAMPEP_0203872318 /NCGR_PEP_ID=MMETSP0359-20131031/19183_1 /ASSEMBLY_ACC=CAM_ASM_000338 /TAXON_ID=268821 /ORGANISM="Scrippsiella Hangoei, Strain SHTV-5" /LENGTH=440 /DNA_ID=CAMNT_0050791003 /DNA_START=73 /DNA_END=1395 /DNA_ORIENTATION=+
MINVLIAISPLMAIARDDGLRLPPMGWMSWERYGCQRDCVNHPDTCISAKLFETQAELLVSKGFLAKGYNRVDIDDCYMDRRDPKTNDLRADEARFPGGIPALSEKIHFCGLKFGIYNDIGPGTCASDTGLNVSAGPDEVADAQLQRDVEMFAHEWKVDSLKVDGCGPRGPMNVTYPKLGDMLNRTGRQILFSCSWPVYGALGAPCNGDLSSEACFPSREIAKSCSTWRVFKDIMDVYNLPGHAGLLQIIDFYARNNETLAAVSGPGQYNDYDMLLAGNAGLSVAEAKIQMGMWSMWSAPLMISNDLRTIAPEFIDVLLNDEVIAIDQDPLSASAKGTILVNNSDVMSAQISVWHKPLADGSRAVALLNTGVFDASTYNLTITASMVGLQQGSSFSARSLWERRELGEFRGSAQFWLEPISILMLKVTAKTFPSLETIWL